MKNIGTNQGLQKEAEFAAALNKCKVKDLNYNLNTLVNFMFNSPDENCVINAEQIMGRQKPDIKITCNNLTHYLSYKSGTSRNVHQEGIKQFIDYLSTFRFSKDTIDTVALWLWNDGTTNGTGKRRFSYTEMISRYSNRIKIANEELNSNRKVVIKIINRFLFDGSERFTTTADYIYHGEIDHGILVSKSQMMKYIYVRPFSFYDCLHIGPVIFKPHARYANGGINRQESIKKADFTWPTLYSDLVYISKYFKK